MRGALGAVAPRRCDIVEMIEIRRRAPRRPGREPARRGDEPGVAPHLSRQFIIVTTHAIGRPDRRMVAPPLCERAIRRTGCGDQGGECGWLLWVVRTINK